MNVFQIFSANIFGWHYNTLALAVSNTVVSLLLAISLYIWLTRWGKHPSGKVGIAAFLAICALSVVFGVAVGNIVLLAFFIVCLASIPVIFQPEFRTATEGLREFLAQRRRRNHRQRELHKTDITYIVGEISRAVEILRENATGALLVLQGRDELFEARNTGTTLFARLSTELLLTLTYPGSPLGDGAVIMSGTQITTAGATLPNTTNPAYQSYSQRIRAGIGITEVSDALAIMVSGEEQSIDVVFRGHLTTDITIEELEKFLLEAYKSTIT